MCIIKVEDYLAIIIIIINININIGDLTSSIDKPFNSLSSIDKAF